MINFKNFQTIFINDPKPCSHIIDGIPTWPIRSIHCSTCRHYLQTDAHKYRHRTIKPTVQPHELKPQKYNKNIKSDTTPNRETSHSKSSMRATKLFTYHGQTLQ